MNNAELINELQTEIREIEDDPVNTLRLMWRAADALGAAEKRIAELSLDNKMLRNTIDADKCVMLDRIRVVEAQLPKQGEWIDDNGANVPLDRDGYTTGMCRCSVCNDWLIASDEYEVRGRYCPNCGARMKGEQE